MKKLFLIPLVIAVLAIPVGVFAQEEATEDETTEINLISAPTEEEEDTFVVTPPSDISYTFSLVLEEIREFFTLDPDKKIEMRLEYAEKRLVEMEALSAEGNTEQLEKVQARYERQIAKAIQMANKDADKAEERLDKVEEIRARHLEVLDGVLGRVADEAKPSIEKVIEKTTARYETDKSERQALKKANKGGNSDTQDTTEEIEE
ncbi:hypothetical protein A3K02_02000 [candidate division WS6 bacterium RIFOXYD1_FULL_33_8]|uniref:DUF5667 domain-containing protein n=2 Tax=Candidatus Dojkabacteria TaxID=74243 RepID=A0A0G0AV58_9BACT|nr:MAG: hypothetical protein UR32_C0006G0034 [candidate division WS6 bacterium GW2011_GWE2_33_157]KKP43964.1 MAG: hypothetical protein UR34_C0008G0023 [candidate division WS6 bacterium GW2011_GWC1_33_20]KKP45671.1 MAG: hypothetical protein UR36_C0005G0007 [candidate division WS6 bacterium GW2011_GWF1_33_233]KKP55068.1 MAG: hypothetical protein UR45_C0005G0021 [candidate division WS6 bacterium GW2011_WS6_33_547]KKP55231.1 MAG: hypothetical protein UR47_C0003G0007 [candidate division WS6 bacteriu